MARARLLLVVGLLLAAPAHGGRHQISGRVIDRNGDPIHQAIVSLEPGNVQLVTDHEGSFLIDYLRDEQGERSRLLKRTDYEVEVFKPGFHVRAIPIHFVRGQVVMDPIALTEVSIAVPDDGENLDPAVSGRSTQNTGATYEGQ